MNSAYDFAFEYVLDTEKRVYTNDLDDKGGPTKFGITLNSYMAFVGCMISAEDIENLTETQARVFYFERYWAPLKCSRITRCAIAAAIFDVSVLYGVGTAALLAQAALLKCGLTLKVDGHIGDKSLTALNLVSQEDFLEAFHGVVLERINSVIKLRAANEKYRKGWTTRADRLLTLNFKFPQNGETAQT